MKEAYILDENIDKFTQQIMDLCLSLNGGNKSLEIGSNPCLLVIDAQNYFLDPVSPAYAPGSTSAISNINKLINAFDELDLPIIFTQHENTEQDAGMMAQWWSRLISPDSDYAQIHKSIQMSGKQIVYNKSQYDIFYGTNLENFIIENQISSMIFTGFLTNLCVETSIRSGFVRGFRSFLVCDATAAYTGEHHKSSCINLSHGFCPVCSTSGILNKLNYD